jgi:hypothetical protein
VSKLHALLEFVIGRGFVRLVVLEADDAGALPLSEYESERSELKRQTLGENEQLFLTLE